MKRIQFLTALLVVIVVFAVDCPAGDKAVQLIGVSWDGDTYLINKAGELDFVGETGLSQVNSMATRSDGLIVIQGRGDVEIIATLDPITGEATTFFLPFLNNVSGLAFNSNDLLYGVDAPSSIRNLYILDLSDPDGGSIFVGEITSFPGVQGLVFAPDGTLYGWDVSLGLITINPFTAVGTDINSDIGGTSSIQSLAISDDGVMYGIGEALFEIDPDDGSFDQISDEWEPSIRGAAILPPCIGDFTGDYTVSAPDLLHLLSAWGRCEADPCAPDLNGDTLVDTSDLLELLSLWGTCG